MQWINAYKMQCMKSSVLSGCRPHSNQGFSLSWWLQLNNWNRAPSEHNQPQMAKCLTMSQLQGTVSRAFCSGLWLLVPLCKCLHSNAAGLNTEMDLQIRNGRNGLNFMLCQALENLTVTFKLKKKNLSFSEVNYPSICQISAIQCQMKWIHDQNKRDPEFSQWTKFCNWHIMLCLLPYEMQIIGTGRRLC